MSEWRLATVLTRRFSRVAWRALAGFALLVVVAFAVAAEAALRRSLEHSADVIQSLLGAYTDATGGPGGVMPATLADQLLAMGGQVVITRTTTSAGGVPQVYFLSPGMPAQRLEGLPATASPEDVRRELLAAISRIDQPLETLRPIPGDPPSGLQTPSGCVFHPRCPRAFDRCPAEIPDLREVRPGRWVACHLYE